MANNRWGFLVVAIGSLLCEVGCVATGATSQSLLEHRRLINRASFDLECTGELNVTELDARTRSVGGCGRQATYVQICDAPVDNPMRSCVWVMNGARGHF
ncbi:MAG TPA: hypothetical protein VIQ54_17635 [Polyangia bacterium]|jgi:hypothetical protein